MKAVKVRDLILGDGIPKICVPVIAHNFRELEHALEVLKESSYDLAEFRADFYFEEEDLALSAIRETVGNKPVLYTIRTMEEGGEIEISDDSYRRRNLAAARFADLVDVQLKRLHVQADNTQLHSDLVRRLHEAGTKVVISWHDFEQTPEKEQLVETFCAMQREGCDIAKIAVMPGSRMDVLELMAASVEMLEEKAKVPFITMSMGTLGKVTREAGAFTGSCVTFGTAGAMSAPGQIPADLLRKTLKALDAQGL